MQHTHNDETAEQPAFSFTNVYQSFGTTQALDGFNLQGQQGRVIGLVGRNGAGKSSAIRCLVGLAKPTSGQVRVFGQSPWHMEPALRQRVGYMSESGVPILGASARDLSAFSASLYPHWDRELEHRMLERFRIDPGKPLKKLSLGQQRTVALMLAICPKPDLLVLDEPAANLDAVMRREFIEVVLTLVAEQGGTVLFSSHILSDVERVADRIAFLDRGRLLLDRDTDELRAGVRRLRLVFTNEAPANFQTPGMVAMRRQGRELLITVEGYQETLVNQLAQSTGAHVEAQGLGLEELFIDLLGSNRVAA